jgi:hypothetical protein
MTSGELRDEIRSVIDGARWLARPIASGSA